MREGGAQRGLAVSAGVLRDDGHHGHGHSKETILEHSDPDDLCPRSGQLSGLQDDSCVRVDLTLNHVRPLRGVRQQPLCPPQALANQLSGQTQSLGRMPRK